MKNENYESGLKEECGVFGIYLRGSADNRL